MNAYIPSTKLDQKLTLTDPLAKKVDVLSMIARRLIEHEIMFAVGGSMMLWFHGIVQDFDDIDLMIKATDCEQVMTLLMGLGTMQTADPKRMYMTSCFLEFAIDGVAIDIIGGFAINTPKQCLSFVFDERAIEEIVMVRQLAIPLARLSDWLTYYELMGREDKQAMISSFINHQG